MSPSHSLIFFLNTFISTLFYKKYSCGWFRTLRHSELIVIWWIKEQSNAFLLSCNRDQIGVWGRGKKEMVAEKCWSRIPIFLLTKHYSSKDEKIQFFFLFFFFLIRQLTLTKVNSHVILWDSTHIEIIITNMNEIILDYYHNNSEFASLNNSSLLKS